MPAHRFALAVFLTSGALLAQAQWTRLYPTQSPSARLEHAMAFDEVNGLTVMFGGSPNTVGNETWLFDGANWSQAAAVGPPRRTAHAMVYDAGRGVVVLFGGSAGGRLQDTWEWDGTNWVLRLPLMSPSARISHAMAYDRYRRQTVLFGGWDSAALGDTWEWDGQDWVPQAPATSPVPGSDWSMSFDPTRGGVLLFGGGSGAPRDETWRWDGHSWQQQLPSNPPYQRGGASMVADLARRRVVLWGDRNDPYAWEWDGQTWQLRVTASPSPRPYHAMAYDTVRRQVVIFGGGSNAPYGDTWVFSTDDPAIFETIGPGCAGTAGIAELTNVPYSLPWTGDTFETSVTPTPANAAMFFATGFEAAGPTALDPFGMPGCSLFVTVLETRLVIASPAGQASWTLAIPNSAGLTGVELAQQALILDPGANAVGAVVSSAGRITVGIR